MDTIVEVANVVHQAEVHRRRSRRVVLLVTLDFRDDFNSVRRKDMLGILENSYHFIERLFEKLFPILCGAYGTEAWFYCISC